MKTILRSKLLLLILLYVFPVFFFTLEANAKVLQVGDTISNFNLPDGLTGEKVNFDSNIKGKSKVIIFTFITTTCSACKAEVTVLSDIAKQNENLSVYAICVDLNGEKTVPLYEKTFNFKINYLLDPEFYLPQKFGFTYTPALIMATGEGEILFLKGGFIEDEADDVRELIEDALR